MVEREHTLIDGETEGFQDEQGRATGRPLQAGDEVTMEIDGIGILENRIVKDDSEFSILAKKKK